MNLIINKEVIERLKKEEFYPDTMMSAYLALVGLHLGKVEELDLLDDFNTSRRMVTVYYDLLDRGLWREAINKPLNFQETEKGTDLVKELLELANPTPKIEKLQEPVEDWIQSWIELFPKGVKSGGKLLRSDAKGCLTKMKKFVKENSYSKEVIMQATSNYLGEREREGWKYCKCATYLISKEGQGSELAALCADLQDTETELVYPIYTDNGLI